MAAAPHRLALGQEHALSAGNHHPGRGIARTAQVFGVGMNHKIGSLRRIGAAERRLQEGRADGGIADHRQSACVRQAADAWHVEHVAVWIAGGLEVDEDLAPRGQAIGVARGHRLELHGELRHRFAVKPFERHVEIGLLAIPVVQQLVGAAIDVAAGQHDVARADQVRERGVDRRHAGIEIPGEVGAGLGARLRARCDWRGRSRWVEQARVDLVQQLATLEGIFDPLGAGIDVGGRARDHGRRAEQRRDIVEQGIRALGTRRAHIIDQRLVGRAQRVLQGVEHLGELEAGKALRVVPGNAILPIEAPEGADGEFPQFVCGAVGGTELAHESPQGASALGVRIDTEVAQLLDNQLGQRRGGTAVPQGAQLQRVLKFLFAVHAGRQSTHSLQ